MRLTLRTMLAYMDDVLDPADADELKKKIEESDFASGLVDRIRGVMGKLRMDAPKVDGKGMGNDANTIAEYLDSALEQDRVAEFERVCLESDKHLCEVAACHQVLTIVLGKPADVATELRERIYALGDPEKASVHSAASAADHAARRGAPPASDNGRAARKRPPLEVPEYLRSSRESSMWPMVGIMAAALILILIVLATVGPLKGKLPLAGLFGGGQQIARTDENEPAGEATTAAKQSTPTEAATTTSSDAAATTAEPSPAAVASAAPGAPAAVGQTTEAAPTATSEPAPTNATERIAASPPAAATTATTTGDAATTPAAPTALPPTVEPGPAAAAPTGTIAIVPKLPKKAPAAETPKPKPVEVGRYISDAQLFATLGLDDGQWYAKQSQEILTAGERLVVLPPYRPQIALPSAVWLTFAGDGALTMQTPDENRTPRVAIDYGRFLVSTAGKEGAQVQLDLAGIKGLLTLIDADSELAIKVARWVPPGVDPELPDSGSLVVEMYNRNGRATWQPAEQAKIDIPKQWVYVYYADVTPEMHGPFYPPEWIDAKNIKPIDAEAAGKLEKLVEQLDLNRPLVLSLQEATKDRRVEVRSLAARDLAALGEFEPILRELGDEKQRSFWLTEFDALRRALERSPETAVKIHQTVKLARAADAAIIWRLLWSYSEDQLKTAADELIKNLDHDQLDVRVLSYANLVSITGLFGSYLPERPAPQRKSGITDWAKRRDKGAIIYKAPPSPLDTYKPVPAGGASDAKAGAAAVGTGMK